MGAQDQEEQCTDRFTDADQQDLVAKPPFSHHFDDLGGTRELNGCTREEHQREQNGQYPTDNLNAHDSCLLIGEFPQYFSSCK